MTFLELCRQMRQESGIAGTGPLTTEGQTGEMRRVVDWTRQAWVEIQSEQDWKFDWAQGSVTLNATETVYDLPADFDDWITDTLKADGDKVKQIAWRDFHKAADDYFAAVAISPDNKLHLNAPTSKAALTFEYFRTPQELTADSDVPRMPERYHMAIIYRAMFQYAMYENAQEVAQQAQMNDQKMMQRIASSELPDVMLGESLA